MDKRKQDSILKVVKKQLKDYGQGIQFAHGIDSPSYFDCKALVTFSRQKYQDEEFYLTVKDAYNFITLEKPKVKEFIYWNGGVYKITSIDNSVEGLYKNVCEYIKDYGYTYSLSIVGDSGDLEIGDTRQLSLKLFKDEEEVVDLSAYNFLWSTISESVATVSESGLVAGIGEGSTNVLVTMQEDNNVNATYTIKVVPKVILTLLGDHKITETYKLYKYSMSDARTNVLYELTYSEGDINDYFLVNNTNGMFNIKAYTNTVGTIYVKVTDSESGKLLLTDEIKVDTNSYTFSITNKETQINTGNTLQITNNLIKNNNETVTGYTVNYSSDNEEIATISETGLITAISDGTVIITANATEYGLTDTLTLEVVTKVDTYALSITNTETQIDTDSTLQINTQLIKNDSETVTGYSLNYSSSDESIATIDNNGLITSVSAGTVVITVTTTGYGGLTATYNLEIIQAVTINYEITCKYGDEITTIGQSYYWYVYQINDDGTKTKLPGIDCNFTLGDSNLTWSSDMGINANGDIYKETFPLTSLNTCRLIVYTSGIHSYIDVDFINTNDKNKIIGTKHILINT